MATLIPDLSDGGKCAPAYDNGVTVKSGDYLYLWFTGQQKNREIHTTGANWNE